MEKIPKRNDRELINIKILPHDCLSHILIFISKTKELVSVFVTIKGIFEYMKFNPTNLRNVRFQLLDIPTEEKNYVQNLVVGDEKGNFDIVKLMKVGEGSRYKTLKGFVKTHIKKKFKNVVELSLYFCINEIVRVGGDKFLKGLGENVTEEWKKKFLEGDTHPGSCYEVEEIEDNGKITSIDVLGDDDDEMKERYWNFREGFMSWVTDKLFGSKFEIDGSWFNNLRVLKLITLRMDLDFRNSEFPYLEFMDIKNVGKDIPHKERIEFLYDEEIENFLEKKKLTLVPKCYKKLSTIQLHSFILNFPLLGLKELKVCCLNNCLTKEGEEIRGLSKLRELYIGIHTEVKSISGLEKLELLEYNIAGFCFEEIEDSVLYMQQLLSFRFEGLLRDLRNLRTLKVENGNTADELENELKVTDAENLEEIIASNFRRIEIINSSRIEFATFSQCKEIKMASYLSVLRMFEVQKACSVIDVDISRCKESLETVKIRSHGGISMIHDSFQCLQDYSKLKELMFFARFESNVKFDRFKIGGCKKLENIMCDVLVKFDDRSQNLYDLVSLKSLDFRGEIRSGSWKKVFYDILNDSNELSRIFLDCEDSFVINGFSKKLKELKVKTWKDVIVKNWIGLENIIVKVFSDDQKIEMSDLVDCRSLNIQRETFATPKRLDLTGKFSLLEKLDLKMSLELLIFNQYENYRIFLSHDYFPKLKSVVLVVDEANSRIFNGKGPKKKKYSLRLGYLPGLEKFVVDVVNGEKLRCYDPEECCGEDSWRVVNNNATFRVNDNATFVLKYCGRVKKSMKSLEFQKFLKS